MSQVMLYKYLAHSIILFVLKFFFIRDTHTHTEGRYPHIFKRKKLINTFVHENNDRQTATNKLDRLYHVYPISYTTLNHCIFCTCFPFGGWLRYLSIFTTIQVTFLELDMSSFIAACKFVTSLV